MTDPRILRTPTLDTQALLALSQNRLAAVRVPNFYSSQLCEEIAEKMASSELYGQYANAPLIGRVGQSFFETLASDQHRLTYESNAVRWVEQMRSACSPYLSPIDQLRLKLDESWPGGSTLGALNGKKMFVGLARVFSDGADAEPHQDLLSWDAPTSSEAKTLQAQFAANVYLKIPPAGGALLIWPRSLSPEEYEERRIPGSYGVRTEGLNCEVITIKPEPGELILFNSTFIHAVQGSKGGDRITWSCFIGVRDTNSPLIMWS